VIANEITFMGHADTVNEGDHIADTSRGCKLHGSSATPNNSFNAEGSRQKFSAAPLARASSSVPSETHFITVKELQSAIQLLVDAPVEQMQE